MTNWRYLRKLELTKTPPAFPSPAPTSLSPAKSKLNPPSSLSPLITPCHPQCSKPKPKPPPFVLHPTAHSTPVLTHPPLLIQTAAKQKKAAQAHAAAQALAQEAAAQVTPKVSAAPVTRARPSVTRSSTLPVPLPLFFASAVVFYQYYTNNDWMTDRILGRQPVLDAGTGGRDPKDWIRSSPV
jgi:hypothetical protein